MDVVTIDSKMAGPTVWLVAGIHGDEVGGTAVLHDLLKLLTAEPLLRGQLKALPVANPEAWYKTTRLLPQTSEDLNDCFPGQPSGSEGEQLAAKIFATIIADRPDLVIDLHNDWRRSVAYLLLDPLSVANPSILEPTRRLAQTTGLPVVREAEHEAADTRHSLSGSLVAAGLSAFTLELGESGVVNEGQVRVGLQSLWNVLAALKMVETKNDLASFHYPPEAIGQELSYAEALAPSEGLIRFSIEPGEMIKKGQILATIDPLKHPRQAVVVERPALVLALTDAALATPDAPLVALGLLQ